ncbi:hypothetical protein KM043_001307 [Ampulex compressa]|nr:hypothetical protein KM043_001307 [Ampulex compressa]
MAESDFVNWFRYFLKRSYHLDIVSVCASIAGTSRRVSRGVKDGTSAKGTDSRCRTTKGPGPHESGPLRRRSQRNITFSFPATPEKKRLAPLLPANCPLCPSPPRMHRE